MKTLPGMAPGVEDSSGQRVAIILVNWNGWSDTLACLDSILSLRHRRWTVFVVDNLSSDGSQQKIRNWLQRPGPTDTEAPRPGVKSGTASRHGRPISFVEMSFDTNHLEADIPEGTEVVLVQAGANLGFAGGNNVGMKCAGLQRYDYFWLLNTDTVIRDDTLTELLHRSASDAELGMIGSTLVLYWNPTIVQALGGGSFDFKRMRPQHLGEGRKVSDVGIEAATVERDMAYVVGASMLVSSRFVRDIGWMSEDYFLYFEELDWAVRAFGRYRVAYAPRSVVYHKVGGSSARVASLASARVQYVSRLKFVARYFPRRYAALLAQMALDEMPRHLLKGRWVHARALLGALGRAAAAYREGVAGRPASYVELPVFGSART